MHHPHAVNQARESRVAGHELALAFSRGFQPQTVNVRMALGRDEFCVGQMPVLLLRFTEAETSYTHKSGGYVVGSSPGGLVLGTMFSAARFTGNVVGNHRRRARAAREAAAQWRPVDQGTLYLTNRRFAIQGQAQWHDLWFQHIRMSDCDSHAILLEVGGFPSTALDIPHPDYWFVMFNKLAYDTIVTPPHPDGPY